MRCHISLLVSSVLLLGGACSRAMRTEAPLPELYQPAFDYSLPPELRGSAGSVRIVISLLQPQLADQTYWLMQNEAWRILPSRMAGDLEEMIVARGFVFQGPYNSQDEVVWPERIGSDFFVRPEIDIQFTVSNLLFARKCGTIVCIGDRDADWRYYIRTGLVALTGRIDLAAIETVTSRTLWRRSFDVDVQPSTFSGNPKVLYASRQTPSNFLAQGLPGIMELLADEPGLQNSIGKALEATYKRVLDAIARQLDPREMLTLKKMADQMKKERR